MKQIWNKHSHTIITAILVAGGCVFGYGMETLLLVGGFWFGREHSQAEYRFMNKFHLNRSKLGFFDGFNPLVWNYDSFVNDLVLPIVVGLLTIWVLHF